MKRAAIITACLLSALGWTLRCDRDDDEESKFEAQKSRKILEDRVWVNLETGEAFYAFALVDGGYGAFLKMTERSSHEEEFEWRLLDENDTWKDFELSFPQRNETVTTKIVAWECNESDEAGNAWELCAVVSDGDAFEQKAFYSLWEMEVDRQNPHQVISEMKNDLVRSSFR